MKNKRHLDARGKGEILYDYKYDILTFKIKGREYKKSIEFQNFVADIDSENFVTGVRIFDASRIFGIDKYILKNIIHCEFQASIENNVITIIFKFVGKRRNKIIPLITKEENFTQRITTPIGEKLHLQDSSVECPMEA
jgi:hypothetical protein